MELLYIKKMAILYCPKLIKINKKFNNTTFMICNYSSIINSSFRIKINEKIYKIK